MGRRMRARRLYEEVIEGHTACQAGPHGHAGSENELGETREDEMGETDARASAGRRSSRATRRVLGGVSAARTRRRRK